MDSCDILSDHRVCLFTSILQMLFIATFLSPMNRELFLPGPPRPSQNQKYFRPCRAGTRKVRTINVCIGHRPQSRIHPPRLPSSRCAITDTSASRSECDTLSGPHPPSTPSVLTLIPTTADHQPTGHLNSSRQLLTRNETTDTTTPTLCEKTTKRCNLKIVLLNARSVRNKIALIYEYI